VIAAVRRKQRDEAATLGVDQVIATDNPTEFTDLQPVDAIADNVGFTLAETLMSKVKDGGVFASVLGAPANAKEFPKVKVVSVVNRPDPSALLSMADAVKAGKLKVAISGRFPLSEAAAAHAVAESGASGKTLLVVNP